MYGHDYINGSWNVVEWNASRPQINYDVELLTSHTCRSEIKKIPGLKDKGRSFHHMYKVPPQSYKIHLNSYMYWKLNHYLIATALAILEIIMVLDTRIQSNREWDFLVILFWMKYSDVDRWPKIHGRAMGTRLVLRKYILVVLPRNKHFKLPAMVYYIVRNAN